MDVETVLVKAFETYHESLSTEIKDEGAEPVAVYLFCTLWLHPQGAVSAQVSDLGGKNGSNLAKQRPARPKLASRWEIPIAFHF